MRSQVVPSSPLKFLQSIRSPIGSVVLQTVTEYRIRGIITECFHQAISDCVKMSLDGSLIIVVEDKSFGTDRRTFHRHSRPAGDEENHHARGTPFRGDLQTTVLDHQTLDLPCVAERESIT